MAKRIAPIVLLVVAIIVIFWSGAVYPQTMTVEDVQNDTVYLRTASGISYTMNGAEDYEPGDTVGAIMLRNVFTGVSGDFVLVARYCG